MHKCKVINWNNEDQAFIEEAPEWSGCMAHGADQQSARRNTADAMRLWVEVARRFGAPVPQPKKPGAGLIHPRVIERAQ